MSSEGEGEGGGIFHTVRKWHFHFGTLPSGRGTSPLLRTVALIHSTLAFN